MLDSKNWMARKLRGHIGHNVVCVCYGDIDDPADICIECEDCEEVLVSSEDFNELQAPDDPNEVTEWCANCGNEITMQWNVISDGYKTFCPICGKRLMLCDACMHRNNGELHDDCDYNSRTDTCRFNLHNADNDS